MKKHSLFWPFVLIATGAVWLMINLRYLPVENLWALMYIWPFFLLAAGVGLILHSFWPVVRSIVSGLLVLGMLLAIVFAAQLGWNRPPAWNFIQSVNVGGSLRGSGVIKTESRSLADFSAVQVDFPAEITVQQGAAQSVSVTAEDNLLPQLATRVSNGTLYIEDTQPSWSQRVNPTRPVHIDLTVKDLQSVDFPSAGTLTVDGLQTDSLSVTIAGAGTVTLSGLNVRSLNTDLSGAGNFTASGAADSLNVNLSGFGGFNGGDLACQSARVTISGAGSATVWAKTSLSAEISGTGSVDYYGSPSVTRSISGLGSVNGLGNK